ncbi:MAG: BON domain-containing protein [Candidatus Midichloria sp.]|nr:BON domain-containing protein [Candidatus Midichloria sp.]
MADIRNLGLGISLSLSMLLNTGCGVLVPVAATTTAGMIVLDERTSGELIDDTVVITKIKSEFSKTNASNLLTKIGVNSYEGRVMLTGTLKAQEYVDEAVRRAWLVHGVKEVINELVVAPTPQNKAKDIWISSQIKTKYLLEKHFDSLNYKYDVNDSVVYLLGVAQSQDELERAIKICSKIHGVEKVVNHVILKTDQRRKKTY